MQRALRLLAFITILILNHQFSYSQAYYYDSVNFETPVTSIIIDTSDSNIWQIGEPDKIFFNAAYSGINAIMTDTLNYYPVNNQSSFTYIIRNPYTQTCVTKLEFWHKYDTDSLKDIGTIEASYDGGNSWLIVKDTSLNDWGPSYFYWDMDYHPSTQQWTMHELNITGKSDGWIRSSFTWQWYIMVRNQQDTIIMNPDSLMVRFNFISDGLQENKEGWMIDQIVTSSGTWEICSSTRNIRLENNINAYPNPFKYSATIEFRKELTNGSVSLYDIFGKKVMEAENIKGNEITIFRNDLKSGVYTLHLTENNILIGSKRVVIID